VPARRRGCHAAVVDQSHVARREGQGVLEIGVGLGKLRELEPHQTAIVPGGHEPRFDSQGLRVGFDGPLEMAELLLATGEIDPSGGEVRGGGDGPLEVGEGLGDAALLVELHAQLVDVRSIGLQPQRITDPSFHAAEHGG
jgi:hypothetical protein